MMANNPNLDLVNINAYTHVQNLVKFCPFFLKILSRNEILTSSKGHNSVTNLGKMTGYNPNLDLVNFNAKTNFDEILSIYSKYIEQN